MRRPGRKRARSCSPPGKGTISWREKERSYLQRLFRTLEATHLDAICSAAEQWLLPLLRFNRGDTQKNDE